MFNEDKTPAASEPVNPLIADTPSPAPAETVTAAAETVPESQEKQEPKADDSIAKFEAMLKASQSMIGKQSGEIGALRAKLEEMTRPPAGPSEDDQLANLYKQMDAGEIDIAEGMRQALAINSNQTASRVMNQLSQQQQQGEIAKIQGKFLKENPDYETVLQSGALNSYLETDPLADEYTAYHKYKADEKIKSIMTEHEAKLLAAKEEGARLAKGAEPAGKVLGKQGSTAMVPQGAQRPFANNQEATAAMMATLKQMRSSSTQ